MVYFDLDEYLVMRNVPMQALALKRFVQETFEQNTVRFELRNVRTNGYFQGAVNFRSAFTNINSSFGESFSLLHGTYKYKVVYGAREKTIASESCSSVDELITCYRTVGCRHRGYSSLSCTS